MEITIYKPEQVAVAFGSEKLKAQAAQIAEQCNEIIIVDDSSLAIAQQLLTSANKTVALIEKTRKTLKQPFIDMGNKIQTVAKELSEEIEEAVKSGKEKILAYNTAQEAKKKIEQEKLEEQAREAERTAALDRERIKTITDWIKDFEQITVDEINVAETAEDLGTIFKNKIKTFPEDKFFEEFLTDAKAALDRVKAAGKARKTYVDKLATVDAGKAAELKRKEEKRQDIINRDIALKAETLEEKAAEAIESVDTQKDLTMAEVTGNSVALANEKVSGITKRWAFKIVDMNKVPRGFLKVDEPGIRKWMNDNKEMLNDGEVIDGIEYFIEKGVRLS